jgi:hypothetical protein
MRGFRSYLIGGVAGAVLMAGGVALADVPDTQPSAHDPAHILWLCVAPNSTPWKNVYVLDASQGTCPSANYTKVPVSVAIPGSAPPVSTTTTTP